MALLWLNPDISLALIPHKFSIQLTSHFPSFTFSGREIWISPVDSNGSVATAEKGTLRIQGTPFRATWCCCSDTTIQREMNLLLAPKLHFPELLNIQYYLILHSNVLRL